MTAIRTALLVTALALLPACATGPAGPALDTSVTDIVFRQFDCLETGPDGTSQVSFPNRVCNDDTSDERIIARTDGRTARDVNETCTRQKG